MILLLVIVAVVCLGYYRKSRKTAKVKPNSAASDPRNHAIVIGAGISGLVTAAVLSRHFRRVTIIERDPIPSSADYVNRRRNPPQASQGHGLQPLGSRVFDRFLPGFSDELVKSGGSMVELSQFFFAIGKIEFDPGDPKDPDMMRFNTQTRPFLEWHLRQRILQNPNIIQKQGTVSKLLYQEEKYDPVTHSPSKRKIITGVLWKPKQQKEKEETKTQDDYVETGTDETEIEDEKGGIEELKADFIACCMGRQFPLLKWLKQLGCPDIPVESLTINACYQTAIFRGTPEQQAAVVPHSMIQVPGPGMELLSGIAVFNAEHGLKSVTGFGYGKDAPSVEACKDVKAMLPWADRFDYPWGKHFRAILSTWEQVTPFRRFIDATISWRHFEKLSCEDWPDRFCILGDAVCSFNPLFGQGMAHAAKAAETLDDILERATHSPNLVSLDGLAYQFQQAHAKVSGVIWEGNKPDDMCRPSTKEKPSKSVRLTHELGVHILKTLAKQKKQNFLQMIAGGILPPTNLFHPSILFPALIAWAKESWTKSPHTTTSAKEE